jgi:hypothetical protein
MLIGISYMVMLVPSTRSFIGHRRSFNGAIADLVRDVRPYKKLYGYELEEAEKGAIAFKRGSIFHEFKTPEELEAALQTDNEGIVLINGKSYAQLASEQNLPGNAVVAGRYDYGRKTLLLLCNSYTAKGITHVQGFSRGNQ